MGTPFTGEVSYWEKAASVCAHRLVNVYCKTDWVLALAYRYMLPFLFLRARARVFATAS